MQTEQRSKPEEHKVVENVQTEKRSKPEEHKVVENMQTEQRSKPEEHKVVENVSSQKVDDYQATNLFDMVPVDSKVTVNGSKLSSSDENPQEKVESKFL